VKLEESYLARRRFLCGMLGGGAAALGAMIGVPLVQYAGNIHSAPPPEFVVLEPEDYDLPPGKAKIILYGHLPVLLLRPPGADGPLRIFSATCTHLNCTVSYQEDQERIYCACHAGVFDTEGRVLSGPPPAPLRPFWSKRSGDKLVIAMEKENLEKAP
jgi:nitrite reductase/ring-hydroxylating ferredoxin subunit